MRELKIAYLGSGPISNFHIPSLKKVGFKVETLFSKKNSLRAQEFSKKHKLPQPEENFSNFLNKIKKVDAIVVAIQTEFVPKHLKILAKYKKPILVEKPGAMHFKHLLNLKNNKIYFAYNRRFYNGVKEAKKFLKENPHSLTQVNYPDTIKTKHQFVINGCHIIDLLLYLFSDIKILNVYRTKKNNGFVVIFQTPRKDIISLFANWGSPDNFSISINSNNKKFELKPLEIGYLYDGMEIVQPTKKYPLRSYRPKKKKEFFPKNFKFKPGFIEQYYEFREIVENKIKSKKLCDLNGAIKNLKIIHKILKYI